MTCVSRRISATSLKSGKKGKERWRLVGGQCGSRPESANQLWVDTPGLPCTYYVNIRNFKDELIQPPSQGGVSHISSSIHPSQPSHTVSIHRPGFPIPLPRNHNSSFQFLFVMHRHLSNELESLGNNSEKFTRVGDSDTIWYVVPNGRWMELWSIWSGVDYEILD